MTVPVAVALPTLKLSKLEEEAVAGLRHRLMRVRAKNAEKSNLYESKRSAFDLGIAAPDHLADLVNAVCGWPGIVVDVLEERLEFRGWTGVDDLDLDTVVRDNQLLAESGRGHLDALIYGAGFVTTGRGAPGEPEILVSVESTENCTVDWDYRLRRAKSGLSITYDDLGVVSHQSLYLPDETIMFEHRRGDLVIVDRDKHGLGRVPIARMVNKDRASDVTGRSEITRGVVYLTDAAIRTLLGMEINREFYTSPKWTALNVNPAVFGMDEKASRSQNRRAGWTATQGRFNAVPPQYDEDGNLIEVKLHEFRPAPPTPYIDQVKAYSQLLAAESGIPAPYLGFVTENPSSADSIRQQEYRLVKRAERRQVSFGLAWMEVARLALMMRGDFDAEAFRKIGVSWRDASTPTRAASADEAAKLIGAGVLPPTSVVTYDRIGLSAQEQQQLGSERRRAEGAGAIQELLGRGGNTSLDEANALKVKADAMAVMIRAGVKPDVAAQQAGIEGLEFLEGRPITLKYDDEK